MQGQDKKKIEAPKVTLDDLIESGEIHGLSNYEKDLSHELEMMLEDLPF